MGVVCFHIPADGQSVRLVDPENPQRILAGPEPLDQARFAAAGDLNAVVIQSQLFPKTNNAASFVATGRKLFDAVFKGPVLAAWTQACKAWETELEQWEQQRSGPRPVFRTSLCVQNEEMAAIPWELMHSATASLFQSQYACCMRCVDPVPRPRADAGQLRIRVLLINGADPKDVTIQAGDETSDIESVLGLHEHGFDVETIRTAELGAATGVNELEAKIRKFAPHVLHFIGHSEAAGGGRPAALLLHDGAHYIRWTTLQIANFLDSIPALRLAYLNACRTQRPGPMPTQTAAPAYSLADAFLRRSLSVIAMQYDVRGPAAALCARALYSQLADNSTVDQAICAARHKLTGDFGAESPEPYLPALVIRARPEQILRLRPEPEQPSRKDVEDNVSPLAAHFVNHTHARREVYDYLFGAPQERRAVLVLGESGVGKSWLIKWTLYCLVLRGIRVHYIGQVKDNWLDILRQIRNPGDCLLSQGCCDDDQANRFNWAFKHLSTGDEVPPYQGAVELDEGKTLSEILEGPRKPTNDFPQKLSNQLLTILDSGAETVLAIDQWDLGLKGVEDSTFQLLYKNFLDPLARRRNSPVRLVLSLKGAIQEKDFPGWRSEPLAKFRAGDLPKYAVQLLKKMYGAQVLPHHIAFVQGIAVEAISARELHDTLAGFRGVFFT